MAGKQASHEMDAGERHPVGDKKYASTENFPAMIYPNPLNPQRYVVINTAMTFEERGYRGDYGMPMLGDYAILKANGTDNPEVVTAGLFGRTMATRAAARTLASRNRFGPSPGACPAGLCPPAGARRSGARIGPPG